MANWQPAVAAAHTLRRQRLAVFIISVLLAGGVSSPRADALAMGSASSDGVAATLSVSISGQGSVWSVPGTIDCPSFSCSETFPDHTQVTLTAEPAFDETLPLWQGCEVSATDPRKCVVQLQAAPLQVNVQFLKARVLTLLPGNWGSVALSPGGVDPGSHDPISSCGSLFGSSEDLFACQIEYPVGQRVRLDAFPAPGSRFFDWSHWSCPRAITCRLTLGSDLSVTALFDPASFYIDVSGPGVVVSTPPGIRCSGSGFHCSALFRAGTNITLTAFPTTAAEGPVWTGGCAPVKDRPRKCVAPASGFYASVGFGGPGMWPPAGEWRIVTIGKRGSGRVRGPGINCGTDCRQTHHLGERIILRASAGSGWAFKRWIGRTSCRRSTCSVSVGAVTSLVAVFRRR